MRLRTAPLSALLLLAAPARALALEDVVTARSLAMGNALRAEGAGALGPQLNPGAMPLQKAYTVELAYGFRVQDVGSTLHVSIADSITSRVAAGLFYNFVWSKPRFSYADFGPVEASRQGHETGTSIAIGISERFGFGLTLKYVNIKTTVDLPGTDPMTGMPVTNTATLDTSTVDADAKGFTLDVGIGARLGDSFRIGLVGYNLVPLYTVEAPMAMAIGLAYNYRTSLTISLDTVINFNGYHNRSHSIPQDEGPPDSPGARRTTVRVGGGLEWLIAGKVPLQFGSFYDSGRPGTYISAGLGYQHPRFGIDVGYRQKVSDGNESIIMAGLRVFVQ